MTRPLAMVRALLRHREHAIGEGRVEPRLCSHYHVTNTIYLGKTG